jgi:hypothetical protein
MKNEVVVIPLSAIINGDRVIGPDLSDETWTDLKMQHKKGLSVIMICGAKGHLRTSKSGLKHFYHAYKSNTCGCEPESLNHLKIKNQIYQLCKSEGWWAQPEYQSPSGDWRADVFAVKYERKIIFEIQLSIIDLGELKRRDANYHRDGIESYWILKDYLKIFPYDDSKVVAKRNSGIYIDTYINESDLFLDREQEIFIKHGIHTIGINAENLYLYTADITDINISDWVKTALTGEYKKKLKDFEINHQKKQKLRELARPVLDRLCELGLMRFEYDSKIKKIYAIFKSNKWEDRSNLQQEIHEMYSTYDTFKKSWGKIFSPKNGFVWKDYMNKGHETPLLSLMSENQIASIHNQIIDLENDHRKFVSIFNIVNNQVKTKSFENQERVVPLYRENGKIVVLPTSNKILFEFFPMAPQLIESQRGYKYQNFSGHTCEIFKNDALEFENKGYGKIIQF